ncbi:hypothetical protein LTR91_022554 [Friedmanniomyces endolithicus]|uniref:Fucose-specific lectin n=1 Tax=Friedmanniomyces endolithicus TaxID=329885 RepID=A0AAN6HAL0_9PEZI|nr:hypothetical protein LTR75_017168 [Friedmanniomyces endolithicus]KAK0826046.1 hypothetical protein LTR03_017288 [Friedmanniomyces endolithicus]KAK0891544.1 hypothetical protein LTR57_024744 [Friedmanniomyces endolithicus]KAK0956072.1 hypothetical protein LTR91_022554 [Friedmanniomyces endolithicus]
MPSKERLQEDPGPQAVAIDDGLEVVPEFRLRAPLDRNSSLSKPEHYLQPPASMREEKIVSQDQRPYGYLQDTQAPEVLEPATYEVNVEEDVVGQVNKRSRKCGMKRSAFVWLIVAVVVIVMIAAILGGVLGSVLRTNNTQQAPPSNISTSGPTFLQTQAMDQTGLALLSPAGGSTLYSYYLDIDGAVLENQWENGLWLTSGHNISNTYVVTSDVAANSPLAAISYTMNSTTFRQLFFFDGNGLVTTVNTSGGSNWSEPYNVLPNATSLPNTLALAAIADTQSTGLNGIRLYYGEDPLQFEVYVADIAGSTNGVIQELGVEFLERTDNPLWHTLTAFAYSDPDTGVACVLEKSTNHVYMRNSSTSALQQWQWDYTNPDTTIWQLKATTPWNESIAKGADIAATTDGISTDYIFYQNTNNQTVRALYYGQNITDFVSDLDSLNVASLGYSLSAVWSTGSNRGAVALTQNRTAPTEMIYALITRNGQAEGGTSYTGP